MVTFKSLPKDKIEPIHLMITAHSPIGENNNTNFKEIKLKDGTIGQYFGNSLVFNRDHVSYEVLYKNESIPKDQLEKEIIEIANQML
ncbi:hypothetical protein [Niallia sp. 03133]|uniref:hypothetical protein n=1 Tax=Niallia sp. 03133 TaxID=3458060 RepID=UPI0040444B59